jgi:hypothetical protein
MNLTQESALRAYARMINTGDPGVLAPLLAEDFHYSSQWVFGELTSKDAYLDYITGKLDTIRRTGARVWAEMGSLNRGFPGPCVVLAEGTKDRLTALVLAEVAGGFISRLDMCFVPAPESARRTGEYPGAASAEGVS